MFSRSFEAYDTEIRNRARTAIMEDRFLEIPPLPYEVRILVAETLHIIQEELLVTSVTAGHPARDISRTE
jgi:hypothetical protein